MSNVLRWAVAYSILGLALLTAGVSGQNKDAGKAPKIDKKETKPAPIVLRAQCSRPDATYKVDEPVSFLLASSVGGEIDYVLFADELTELKRGKLRVAPGQVYKLEEMVDRPCFAKLQLTLDSATASAVAAVDPTKIIATAKPPEDFEEFWKAQRDELAKIRVDQVVEFWPKESGLVNVYRVNFAGIDERRVYGWLAVPKGPGPFPAIVTMPYAGVYGISPDFHHANLGAISLNIIIHDFPVDNPDSFYAREAEGPLKNYNRIGWDDREKSIFRYAILAGVRAIDYLANRKDVDRSQIAVTGGSQGGGLALCVSGLDERVGFVAVNIAGLCDLNARSQKRIDGWPHWLASAPKDLKEKVEATSQYFDAVNFARKFKGKSLHGVGFMDTVCPPSTVYAAFNQHPDPKIMIDSPTMAHATDPRWLAARDDFWKANLNLKPAPKPKPKKK